MVHKVFLNFFNTSKFTIKLKVEILFIPCDLLFFPLIYFYLKISISSHQTTLNFHPNYSNFLKL